MSATGDTKLPTSKAVRDTLADLLGRAVDVAPHAPVASVPTDSLAIYVDEHLGTRAIVMADLPCSVFIGSALGLVPAGAAKDAVKDKVLPENARENLAEVLNIVSGLLNQPGTPHVKLYGVHSPGDSVPVDIRAAAAALGRRLDLEVTVPGYGTGVLSVVLV